MRGVPWLAPASSRTARLCLPPAKSYASLKDHGRLTSDQTAIACPYVERSCGEVILNGGHNRVRRLPKKLEQYLHKASKICGAFPHEDAATKGDVPGTPQPGKKMKRRPGEINTLNQFALS
jgi:hypothetical protein